MSYERICRAVAETPWAILPAKLDAIVELLSLQAAGGKFSIEEIRARIGAAAPNRQLQQSGPGAVAVLSLYGVISQRVNMLSDISGGTSTEKFTQAFRRAMADSSVGSIVIDCDSPGGGVHGIQELADEIYRARGVKPVTAVVNSLCASAAYWIAGSASEIVVTPSGELGSIGVFATHIDESGALGKVGLSVSLVSAGRYKVEGNPYEPLGDDARAHIQSRVDDYYNAFVSAVARGRGVKSSQVRSGFGQGRVVGAHDALSLGMADRIGTLDETLARVSQPHSGGRQAQASLEARRRRLDLHRGADDGRGRVAMARKRLALYR